MTETAIIPTNNNLFIAPVTDLNSALIAYQGMKDFVSGVLRKGIDYGEVPGTDKPTLLKPGSEKLARFFGLSLALHQVSVIEDWTGVTHGGEPMFFYRYKAQACRGDLVIAEGIGSCSSWEKKYRYRSSERICPKCGKATIIPGKKEYGGGWLCFVKKGGCGTKFPDKDPEIINQQVGQIANPDPADIVNTVDKMAQKRAIIAAVLLACNASEYFTQDLEDYIDASFVDTTQQSTQAATSKPEIPPEPAAAPVKMSLEIASEVTNDHGVRYDTLDDTTLNNMANTMQQVLDGKKQSKHTREDILFRRDACLTILAHRNG